MRALDPQTSSLDLTSDDFFDFMGQRHSRVLLPRITSHWLSTGFKHPQADFFSPEFCAVAEALGLVFLWVEFWVPVGTDHDRQQYPGEKRIQQLFLYCSETSVYVQRIRTPFFKQQEFSTSPVTQGLTENRLLLPGLVRRKAAFRVRLASQPVSLFTRARTHVTKPEKCCLVFCYRAFLPYVNLRCGICAVKPYT